MIALLYVVVLFGLAIGIVRAVPFREPWLLLAQVLLALACFMVVVQVLTGQWELVMPRFGVGG